MTKNAACVLGTLLCFSTLSCKKEPEPEIVVTRIPTSWIGIGLAEREDYGSKEIRGKNVVVTDVIPSTPADGVLKPGDVFVTLGTRSPASAEDVMSTVQEWPAGTTLDAVVRRDGKDVAVSLRPAARPTTEALLERLYLGKPLPTLTGTISVAETDGKGGIVPGSQCVAEKERACPPIGKSGATNAALGKATVVLFWTSNPYGRDVQSNVFADLRRLHDAYGARGLRFVAVTSDPPSSIPTALRNQGDRQPPMTVVSVFYGGYGGAAYAAMKLPTALLLDEHGAVRAIAAGSDNDLSGLCDRVLPSLLGTAEADTQE